MEVEMVKRLSRIEVLTILKDHGWTSTNPRAVDSVTHEWVDGTDFDSEMGIHDSYLTKDVLNWLGY